MTTQHRDHYGDYVDLLKCHDALLKAAKSALLGLEELIVYLRKYGDNPELAVARMAELRAAIAAEEKA